MPLWPHTTWLTCQSEQPQSESSTWKKVRYVTCACVKVCGGVEMCGGVCLCVRACALHSLHARTCGVRRGVMSEFQLYTRWCARASCCYFVYLVRGTPAGGVTVRVFLMLQVAHVDAWRHVIALFRRFVQRLVGRPSIS